MATTTTSAKRTRAKSAPAPEHITNLRIEPRLRMSGTLTVQGQGNQFFHKVDITDQKSKLSLSNGPWIGPDESEADSIKDAFSRIHSWLNLLEEEYPDERPRINQIRMQLNKHRGELTLGGIPETQEAAAAKESAAAGGIGTMVPNDRPIWKCGECGALNSPELKTCRCQKSGKKRTGADADVGPADTSGPRKLSEENTFPAFAVKYVETIEIPLVRIVEHPDNPRTNYVGIEALAESLKTQGQLVEAIGRVKDQVTNPVGKGNAVWGGSGVELLAGHRRFRAAKLAGLTSLRIRIVEADDAQAIEIMGRDNEDRENFDPVAKARWYQLMMSGQKLSTRQLADKIGVSQADVANHTRILALPKEWLDRVVSGEITGTQARALAPWSERPTVLKEVQQRFKNRAKNVDLSTTDFVGLVRHAVENVTIQCTPGRWISAKRKDRHVSCDVHFTKADIEKYRDQLDIVELGSGRDLQYRAFEHSRFWQLHDPLVKAAEEKAAAKGGKLKPASGKKLTPAQQAKADAEKRAEQDRQLSVKVERYKVRWYQRQLLDTLDAHNDGRIEEPLEGHQILRLLLYFCGAYGGSHSILHDRHDLLSEVLSDFGIAESKGCGRQENVWARVALIKDEGQCWDVLEKTLQTWLMRDPFSNYSDTDPAALVGMAELLGADMARDWRCEEEFLELHTKDQLLALRKEWKIEAAVTNAQSGKRGDLIAAIFQCDGSKRLPLPKSLQSQPAKKGKVKP